MCPSAVSLAHLSCVVVSEHLLAGLPQQVKFTILTGHYSVKKGDALQLSNTDSMPVLHSSTCSARILSSSDGERRFTLTHSADAFIQSHLQMRTIEAIKTNKRASLGQPHRETFL